MIWIGIDCGVNTGFAVWDERRFTEVATLKIHQALHRVALLVDDDDDDDDVTVVIEDARERTWIPRERDIKARVGRAIGAGYVKRDATIWEDFCKDLNIPLVLVPPRNNITKLDVIPFRMITGYTGKTSEHGRDAAMLVFGRNQSTKLTEI